MLWGKDDKTNAFQISRSTPLMPQRYIVQDSVMYPISMIEKTPCR